MLQFILKGLRKLLIDHTRTPVRSPKIWLSLELLEDRWTPSVTNFTDLAGSTATLRGQIAAAAPGGEITFGDVNNNPQGRRLRRGRGRYSDPGRQGRESRARRTTFGFLQA